MKKICFGIPTCSNFWVTTLNYMVHLQLENVTTPPIHHLPTLIYSSLVKLQNQRELAISTAWQFFYCKTTDELQWGTKNSHKLANPNTRCFIFCRSEVCVVCFLFIISKHLCIWYLTELKKSFCSNSYDDSY